MVSSNETMRVLELIELQSDEGPCLDCFRSGLPVVNKDLASVNELWPRFATAALEASTIASKLDGSFNIGDSPWLTCIMEAVSRLGNRAFDESLSR